MIIFTVSCTELIEINVDDAPPSLVIYGYITTDAKQHSIRITRSAGYFSTNRPAGVSHAAVTISDDDGNIFHLDENDSEPGLYQTADNVRGEEGKTYTLNVQVESQHFRASSCLAPINDIDSVRLQKFPISDDMIGVVVYADDMSDDSYYSIFVSINDSVLNSTIDRFTVRPRIINGMPCYMLNQNPEREGRFEIVHEGDKITVNINAISKEYAEFISASQTEIRGSNPIFGGPPANVPTNIKHVNPQKDMIPVVGFFTAYSSRYAEVVAALEDLTVK
jgi:hypothetical protein